MHDGKVQAGQCWLHLSMRPRIVASHARRRGESDEMTGSGKKVGVLLLVVLASATFGGCRRTPDESRIRSAITAVAKGAESASARNVVAPLSDDFDGNGGELDRATLANLVRMTSLRGERVGVTMGPISIDHRGERMIAKFAVTLTSRRTLLPDQMGLYQVESAWRREHGEWRCYSASWRHTL
ncbi:MAG: hypothetical protein ABI178_12775 [Rhodanobacter sp.]